MNRRRIVQMLRFVFVRIYENMQNCLKKIQSYHFNAHKNDRIHIAAYKYLEGINEKQISIFKQVTFGKSSKD